MLENEVNDLSTISSLNSLKNSVEVDSSKSLFKDSFSPGWFDITIISIGNMNSLPGYAASLHSSVPETSLHYEIHMDC